MSLIVVQKNNINVKVLKNGIKKSEKFTKM